MKKTLLCILMMYATLSLCQEKNLQSPTYYFNHFEEVKLATDGIMSDVSRNDFFNVSIENPYTGEYWDMELYDSGLISERYQLRTSEGDIVKSDIIATQGMLVDNPRSSISLTFNHNFIYGYIDDGRDRYFIEPLHYFDESAGEDSFIIYKEKDVIERSYGTCGVTEMQKRGEQIHHDHDHDHDHDHHARSAGECFTLEWAIANDFDMFQEYGSFVAVENHAVGVANNVQSNYDDEFADEISLEIVEMFVVTSSSTDPWTSSTAAGTLLNNFANWGVNGGFNAFHSVGSLWTARDFDGSTIGIAYVGVVCGFFKYNALQDFTSNASTKRVMVAHELGHNFDATHDGQNSGFIMAPSVSSTSTWSNFSINTIESYYNSINCLPSCTSTVAPSASFDVSIISDCVQGQVQYNSTSSGSGLNYEWDFPGGSPDFSTEENPIVFYDNPGDYNVTLTVSNSAGQDVLFENSAVEIFDAPVMGFSYSVDGSTVTINNLSGPVNYEQFDFGDGNVSSIANPTHTYAADGTYTITLYGENQCGNDTFTQDVTIATQPVAGFTQDVTEGCAAFTVNFTQESSDNVANYIWTFPGGIPSTSIETNPSVTYAQVGSYDVTLQVSNPQGNDVLTLTELITVNDLRDPSWNYSFDNDFQVSFQDLNDDGLGSYIWDFGDGNVSVDQNPTHIFAAEGDYTVTFTKSNDCGDAQESQVITISSIPNAGFTVDGSTEVCAGMTVSFINNSSPNADTFLWTFPGGTPATSTEENPTVTYNTPGIYAVTLMANNESGSDDVTLEDYIVVEDIPQGIVTVSVDEDEVTFVNGYSGVESHNWTFGDGTSSSEAEPSKSYDEDGIYDVMYTASNSCGDVSEVFQVTIVTPVMASFTADETSICPGGQVQFMSSASANTNSWSWSFSGGTPSTSTEENPVVTFDQSGVYDITLEVSNDGYTDQVILEDFIVVNPLPESDFGYDINDQDEVVFMNNSTDATAYSWDFGDGNTSSSASPSHVYEGEGVYTVTLTAQNACGVDELGQLINTFGMVSASFSADQTTGCVPQEIQFVNESSANATSYQWDINGPENFSSTEENPLITFNEPGVYDVTLTASNQEFSETIAINGFITINESPTASLGFDKQGFQVSFTAGTENVDSYLWDFGDGNQSTESSPTHTYEGIGDYEVTLTVANECGEDIETVTISIASMVEASFLAASTEGCAPLTVEFINTSSSNVTVWQWDFPGGNPAQSDDPNPVVEYLEPGSYDVSLTASSADGSSDVISREDYVTVIEVPEEDFMLTVEDNNIVLNYDGNAESLAWDLGDGTRVNGDMEISHSYSESGSYTVILTGENECGAFSISKMVEVTMSSTEDVESSAFIIYPNPTTGMITIEFATMLDAHSAIKICDVLGNEVWSRDSSKDVTGLKLIEDLSGLSSGTYLIKIKSETEDSYHRFVKF